MDAPELDRELAEWAGALCALLGERGAGTADQASREAAARARTLLLAGHADRAELRAAFEELDEALRRAGDARGLRGRSRSHAASPSPAPPGLRRVIKVARCPGALPCARREPAPDLRLPPKCAVHGVRMHRESLRGTP
ncbi:hypothetical protein [Streptomyces sp. PR69]|uniref:hypothetical protein n=1 Tax=Streptomyces sp. PR69 TaxID=2984950 RepID=UPI0022641500|nr:hypothetical protein [Streptomyces sp. PR69]